MPMKAECMSLVCRTVKVFRPSAAAGPPGSAIVAPATSEPARNSRRARVSVDFDMLLPCRRGKRSRTRSDPPLFLRRTQTLVLHQQAVAQLGHHLVHVEARGF